MPPTKTTLLICLILIYTCKNLPVDNPTQKLVDYIVNSYLYEGDLRAIEPLERGFQYETTDLNEDGKQEYVIFLSTSYFCGSGGCNLFILDSNFKLIADFSVTTPPIYIDKHSTSGWKNLVLWSDGAYHNMVYNKALKTYPENPSLEPEINLEHPSKSGFEVLFKGGRSKKVYVFK